MIKWIKNYISKEVRKEVQERADKESTWRMNDIERLEGRVNLIMSEEFIDEVVERINKKQIK